MTTRTWSRWRGSASSRCSARSSSWRAASPAQRAAAGGTYLSLAQGEDNRILLASLIVVIAGGLGSLRGAGAAAILVGLVEAFAQTHHAILSVLITFGTLIAVLALRPHGLFGQPVDARH